jgi:hypothetical protein
MTKSVSCCKVKSKVNDQLSAFGLPDGAKLAATRKRERRCERRKPLSAQAMMVAHPWADACAGYGPLVAFSMGLASLAMILPDIEFELCRRDSQLGFLGDSSVFSGTVSGQSAPSFTAK